jgi:hypothetical protein
MNENVLSKVERCAWWWWEVHEGRNNTLVTRGFHGTRNLAVPNVLGTHDYTSCAVGGHGQKQILAVLQGVSTVRPLDFIAVAEVRRVLLHGLRNIGKGVVCVDALGRRHARVDRVREARVTPAKTATPDPYTTVRHASQTPRRGLWTYRIHRILRISVSFGKRWRRGGAVREQQGRSAGHF